MMEKGRQYPFAELPYALVDEILQKCEQIGNKLCSSFNKILEDKRIMRQKLLEMGYLRKDSDIGYPTPPTTCGVDGSYVIERLLANDIVACAAVAIEGLTPPSETRFWEEPRYRPLIQAQKHNDSTNNIVRGIMIEMELELAVKAPHDIVFLDGSFTTPLIYMNQAVNKLPTSNLTEIDQILVERFESFLVSYKTILESIRSDKFWVSIPKYTTRRELGEREELGWPAEYDDRAILTSILQPGEFTNPVPLKKASEPWHLKIPYQNNQTKELKDAVLEQIDRLYVLYYKPHTWSPALRVELSSSIATNDTRLSVLLQGLKYQCATPGIIEPYPLYMADRMVKHLTIAMPAFRQSVTQQIAENYKGDIGEIFFNMHGYRTESGR